MHRGVKWSNLLKWFYPGMKVKRWLLLAGASAVALGIGILLLVGQSTVSALYRALSDNLGLYYLVGSLLALTGLFGIAWGLNEAANSVLSTFPARTESTSDIIWKRRLLSRGPRVVTIGGGTGLSVLLRGLKRYTSNITAIVTVMDDGGSSGRLRQDMGMLPPGDIRNCIIALADDESSMGEVFQHRFREGEGLAGHSLGNLFIAGMEQLQGGFDRAIEETSKLLNIRGQVVPATLTKTNLVAHLSNGERVVGESKLSEKKGAILEIGLTEKAQLHPKALQELRKADIIVLGPGSLYTSLIPNLLVEGMAEEIEEAEATKIFVTNIMTEPGETDGFSARDHLEALRPYLQPSCLDWSVVNVGEVEEELLNRYAQEGAKLVEDDLGDDNEFGIRVVKRDLVRTMQLEGKRTIKHDFEQLAKIIISH